MTNEQATNMLKAKLECLKRETSGTDFGCNNSNCDECSLCYEQGNMGEQKEALDMAIKALEQEPILDKIRAEIAMYEADCRLQGGTDECEKCNSNVFGSIYRIIDKYKTESEDDVNALKAVPTAEERKAGTWKEFHGNKNMCICQSCGFMVNKSLLYDYTEKDPLVFKYCPSCGSYNGGAKRR